ncbi:MAG: YceI family protein [Pseudomonadota bacterium]
MFNKRIPQIVAALMLLPASVMAATIYVTDQGHTEVLFGWSHAGVSQQNAEFTKAKGTLMLEDDIEKSSVNVVIDVGSLASGYAALDRHLKSPDYLGASANPEITFKSTSISKTGEKTFDVNGNLTLNGITKPVTLKATMTHHGKHPVAKFIDYYKGDWIAFQATTEIDHMAFKVGNFSTGPISVVINTELKAK